jgi:hypothetical protein
MAGDRPGSIGSDPLPAFIHRRVPRWTLDGYLQSRSTGPHHRLVEGSNIGQADQQRAEQGDHDDATREQRGPAGGLQGGRDLLLSAAPVS